MGIGRGVDPEPTEGSIGREQTPRQHETDEGAIVRITKGSLFKSNRIIDFTRYSLRLEGVRPQLRQETEQAQVRGEVASTDGRKADRIAMASVKMQAVVVDITILEEQTRRRQWSN